MNLTLTKLFSGMLQTNNLCLKMYMDLTQDPKLQQVVKKNRVQRFKNFLFW